MIASGIIAAKDYDGNQRRRTAAKIESREDIFIVDVRTEEEFKSGSLAGAVNLPLDKLRRGFL